MALQHEQLLEDIENAPVCDLNLTQIAEQADDSNSLMAEIEQAASPLHTNAVNPKSPSNTISNEKSATPLKPDSSTKRNVSIKKKKNVDMK